jgi:glucose/arabinose dehydrogenase
VRRRVLLLCGLLLLPGGVAGAAGRALPPAPGIHVPPGYRVELFARGLTHPTAMAYGPEGRLYVTEDEGRIASLRSGARVPHQLARNLGHPLGLAWHGKDLFVSTNGRLVRLTLRDGALTHEQTILRHLPNFEHQQDNVVLGPDGRLYIGSGSTCDQCKEKDPRSATIFSVRPDGTGLRVEARGLRNPYGLVFGPHGVLYATVNGADKLDRPGDPEPAEMLVRVRRGANYGWPDCWPSAKTLTLHGACSGVTPPIAYLEPHSSADGVVFWRGDVYIAEWGTYFGTRFGRRVVRVHLGADGRAGRRDVSVFARGIAHPLALAVDPQGALLVADWQTGGIYRIRKA